MKPLFIPTDLKVFKYEFKVSPVEFYNMQLADIIPEVHPTNRVIMAYIKVYGENYRKELLDSTICSTIESIRNYESTLRTANLIYGYSPDIKLNDNIHLCEIDHVKMFYLIKDPNIDYVNHKHYKTKATR